MQELSVSHMVPTAMHVVLYSTGIEILVGFMSLETGNCVWLSRIIPHELGMNHTTGVRFDPLIAAQAVLPMKPEDVPHWKFIHDVDSYFAEREKKLETAEEDGTLTFPFMPRTVN